MTASVTPTTVVPATITNLIAAVKAAVPAIATSQARKLIKDNNVRSFKKVGEVTAVLAAKTAEELAVIYGAPEVEPEVTVPVAKTPKEKKIPNTGATVRVKSTSTSTPVEAGPRGFRFGDVWNASVKAGTGIAVSEANRNKLIAQAVSLAVDHDAAIPSKDLAALVAAKL